MDLSREKKCCCCLPLLGALVFFAILWRSDFPKPIYDDLFYTGSSLNLAQGGDLANPLLARQGFPSHYFFLYPPLQSYVTAGWLKIFGISAAAVTALPIFLYFVITAATVAILRKHESPRWLEWLVPLGVAVAFLPAGLRPEPLATALAMAGFALLECGPRRAVSFFPGFLLLFLGASASPRITPFPAALAVFICWRLWPERGDRSPGRWNFLLAAALALALAGFSFLWMIHFQLREFLLVFHLHSSRVGEGKLAMLHRFIKDQRITVWPLWVLFLFLLAAASRQLKHPLNQLGLLVAFMLPVEAVIADLVPHIMWYMILPLFLFLPACLKLASRRQATLLAAGFFAVFCLANLRTFVNVVGIQTGRINSDLGEQPDQALALRSTPEHPVLISGDVARYLFNYHIPPGFIDLGFSTPFPGSFVTTADLRPDDIYLIGTPGVGGLERDTYLPHYPKQLWNPVGLELLSFDRHPRRVFIITGEDCHGLRPGVLQATQ
jgi:hypothetical protein